SEGAASPGLLPAFAASSEQLPEPAVDPIWQPAAGQAQLQQQLPDLLQQQQLLQNDTSLWLCGATPQEAGIPPAAGQQPPPEAMVSQQPATAATATAIQLPPGPAAQQTELSSALPGAAASVLLSAVAPEPARKRQS